MRFGAEFMEVVQPSRCLLGGCVFGEKIKDQEPDINLKNPTFARSGSNMGHPTERDAFTVDLKIEVGE
jgi:hypothetical protein